MAPDFQTKLAPRLINIKMDSINQAHAQIKLIKILKSLNDEENILKVEKYKEKSLELTLGQVVYSN